MRRPARTWQSWSQDALRLVGPREDLLGTVFLLAVFLLAVFLLAVCLLAVFLLAVFLLAVFLLAVFLAEVFLAAPFLFLVSLAVVALRVRSWGRSRVLPALCPLAESRDAWRAANRSATSPSGASVSSGRTISRSCFLASISFSTLSV